MDMDHETLWNLAEEYKTLAMCHLAQCELPSFADFSRDDITIEEEQEEQARFELLFAQIRTAYLFPLLRDDERELLVALETAQGDCAFAVNTHPDVQKVMDVNAKEVEFVELKLAVLNAGFYSHLTPIQKQILESHYFTVPISCRE